jgi:L-rhamnose-H+ transport protein
MSHSYFLGLVWILVAGITQGAFATPMKFVRRWTFEHIWLVYSVIAFFLLPWVIAWVTVPHLGAVYQTSSPRIIWLTALFGLGWGAGSVFFGLGVDALGMALGFSMMTGIYTALGALAPMVVLTPDLIWTTNGALILAGNVITIAGVVVQAVAGDLRDKQAGGDKTPATLNPKVSFATGLAICIASGVLSGMLNFSYAFGKPIAETAQHFGASKDNALNALWLVALPAGGILNVGYCVYLMAQRKSWAQLYRNVPPSDWLQACAMAALWTFSVIFYGWGAEHFGRLGPTLGWSLWNALLIITTVICGLLTREWDSAKGRPLKLLFVGVALLIGGTVVLGFGGAGG